MNPLSHRPTSSKHLSQSFAALVAGLLLMLFLVPMAQAAPVRGVSVLKVQDGHSTLVLKFDKPISKVKADGLARSLESVGQSQADQSEGARRAADIMFCSTGRSYTDSNGTLSLQRSCPYRNLQWGYKISSGVQAIIVSNVNETGLWYWINGVRQSRNSPHNVAKNYNFHGTMSNISNNRTVQYQDYMTFRHNVGSGGTGSITFAGEIATRA